uniref:Sulfatase N-terminal domain-containing protein n=1 Tax=Strongyloides stercoralis TaxID=6248 RepID=A0A0K0ELD8_STRER
MVKYTLLTNESIDQTKQYKKSICNYNIIIVILAIFCIFEYLYLTISTNDNYDYKLFPMKQFSKSFIKDYINYNKSCTINNFDIWDKIIFDYMKPMTRFKNCKKEYKNEFYEYVDGRLNVKKDNITCLYSCKYPKDDFDITHGPFLKINNSLTIDCDVFIVKCYDQLNITIFEDAQFHIRKLENIPKEETPFLEKNFEKINKHKLYDVHVYILDSLSYYHASRALVKTKKYLIEKLNGVEMKYLNTVGDNSRPNAYGFLLNKQKADIIDIFSINETKKNDFGDKDSCYVPLDNTTFIQEYYRRMGYVTLNAEDFFHAGMFNWPNCVGFKKTPVHHSLRPLQVLLKNKDTSNIVKNVFEKKCYIKGFHLMDYMEEFLNKYENKLKMSLLWHTNLLHDSMSELFASDELFYDYFQRNEKHFNKSFNIFMGDHGFRLSSYQSTNMGRYEHRNPYFIITVPEELKSNKELMKNLNENSNKHISHFDVYATILDLLTNAPNDDFKFLNEQKKFPIVNDKIKGLSLLRPIKNDFRSCYEMYIPPQYCLCTPKFSLLPQDMVDIRKKLSDSFIKALNNKIVMGKLTDKCAEMKLDETETFMVKVAKSGNTGVVYKVDAVTTPGKAMYQALIDKNFKVIKDEITRINVYKDQAEVCEEKSNYRKYCYCKSLLNKNK